ncbi:MAG: tetratricopeptide repeat protein [Verrucomicrobiae bacterium]|nr:tetratricopeptide repeat protein [Verrucomicrobiae bacterium]
MKFPNVRRTSAFAGMTAACFLAGWTLCMAAPEHSPKTDGREGAHDKPSASDAAHPPSSAGNPRTRGLSASPSPEDLISILPQQLLRQPWEFSRQLIEKVLSEVPFDSRSFQDTLLLAARCTAANERYGESILYYERWRFSAQMDPRLPQVMVELGRQYRNLGLIKAATDYFYRTLRTARLTDKSSLPAVKSAQWELAETSFQLHDWERARRLFEMFTEANRESDSLTQSAFYRMGDCAFAAHEDSQAIVDYQRALSHNDQHAFAIQARINLLDIFLRRDNELMIFRTLHELAENIKKTPPAEAAHWKRLSGTVLFRQLFLKQSYELSKKIVDAMAALDESTPWQHQTAYWNGMVEIETGNWKPAIAHLKSVSGESIEKNPTIALAPRLADHCEWIVTKQKDLAERGLLPPAAVTAGK